jgi:hypothetical protein
MCPLLTCYCGSTPQVALGSMTWGKQNSEADAHAQLSWAVDAGINFVVRGHKNPTSSPYFIYRQPLEGVGKTLSAPSHSSHP